MSTEPAQPFPAAQPSSKFGSLTQAARTKTLKQSRGILIGVGILTVIANLAFTFGAESIVNSEFNKEILQLKSKGLQIDEDKLAELKHSTVRATQLLNVGACAIGVVFIVLGTLVYRYPVPTTVLGLVIYIASWAVFGVLNPAGLASGWIIKILIVAALFKGVQAAIAYQKQQDTLAIDPAAA